MLLYVTLRRKDTALFRHLQIFEAFFFRMDEKKQADWIAACLISFYAIKWTFVLSSIYYYCSGFTPQRQSWFLKNNLEVASEGGTFVVVLLPFPHYWNYRSIILDSHHRGRRNPQGLAY